MGMDREAGAESRETAVCRVTSHPLASPSLPCRSNEVGREQAVESDGPGFESQLCCLLSA